MEQKWHSHTVGRILFGLPFIVFGIMHFMNTAGMSAMVPEYAPFGGTAWVIITGVLLVLAGLGIIAKQFTREAAILAAVLMAVFVLFVHLPNLSSNMSGLLKDVGLFGGALMLLSRYPKHNA